MRASAPRLTVVQEARLEVIERESVRLLGAEYVRSLALDWLAIENTVGFLAVLPVRFLPGARFDLGNDDEGDPAAIVEAFGRDGASVVDLVAWPLAAPERVASMFGRAAILGAWHAFNPSTYHRGASLRLYRSPAALLRAEGLGAVLVHPAEAARELLDVPGPFAGDDAEHAREISRLLRSARAEHQDQNANRRRAS